jgi:hypothetical protein
MPASWTIDLYNLTGSTAVARGVGFVRATVRWRLDDPGSLEVDLRDDQLGGWPDTILWVPMQRRVVVRRDREPMWAGILLGLDQRIEGGVPRWTARCLGLRAWLERRVVHGDFSRSSTVATTIAWDLISHAQGQSDGNMGFTLGTITGTAPARTRHYCDGDNIAEAIRELADRDTGGFDWEIDAQRRFNAWVGGRGSSVGTRVSPMDCLASGGWEVQGDWWGVDTVVTALGPADTPCGPPLVERSSTLVPPSTYRRWESVVDGDSTSTSELQEIADEQLRASGRGRLRIRAARPGWFGFEDRWERTSLGSDWTARHEDGTGSVTLAGGGSVVVDSAGTGDFAGASDTGSYIYRGTTDYPAWVEVDVLDPGVTQGGTGKGMHLLQLREAVTTAGGRRYGLVFDDDASHITTAWRDTAGGTASWAGENTGVAWDPSEPLRLAISYDGTTARAWVSQDRGATWTQVGSRTFTGFPRPDRAALCASYHGTGKVTYGPVRISGARWPGFSPGDRPAVLLGRRNLWSNPGFELASPLGLGVAATISRDSTEAHSGTYSLKVVTAGNGSTNQSWQSGNIRPVEPGETWTVSAWVKAGAGTGLALRLEWRLPSSGGAGGTRVVSWTASGAWERKSVTGTAPRDARLINIWIQPTGSATTSWTFWIDDVQVEQGDTPTDVTDDQTPYGPLKPTMRVIGYAVTLEPPSLEFTEVELEAV